MNKILLAAFLSVSFFCGIQAQGFVRYKFSHISPRLGLSGSYVRKIIQDPYGLMWIGTQEGLDRYDGKNFVIYNKANVNKHFVTGPDIRDLLLDTALHLIWAINSFGGIDAIDYETGNTVYSYFQKSDRSTADILFSSLALVDDQLYIGSTNGVFALNTKNRRLQKLTIHNPFNDTARNLAVDKILKDRSGNLWVFCNRLGVLRLQKGTMQVTEVIQADKLGDPGITDLRFFDCHLLQDDRILAATNHGLKLFQVGSDGRATVAANPFPEIPITQTGNIYACSQDKKGDLWFCRPNFLGKIPANTGKYLEIREHTSRDELGWLDAIYNIYFDADNNLWLGCQEGLTFSQIRMPGFRSISHSSNSETAIRHAYYIYPVSDTIVYSCAQDGFYRVNTFSGTIKALNSSKAFFHAFTDPNNRFIVSNIDGIFVMKDDQLSPIGDYYPEFRPYRSSYINNHVNVGDSVIIMATESYDGILVWNYKQGKLSKIDQITKGPLHLKENTVNMAYQDKKGLIWVLSDHSISILDFVNNKTQFLDTYDPVHNTFYSIFFDICQVHDLFYIASYGDGVLVLDSNHHFLRRLAMENGLSDLGVYQLLPYKDSLLFVTSNNGLSVINTQIHDRTKSYHDIDGLQSNNFEENSGSVRGNLLYAGGSEGFTIIDPLLLPPPPLEPKLYLQQVSIETRDGIIDTSNFSLRYLEIPSNNLQTTISLFAVNYSNPTRCTFEYRINDNDETWSKLGTNNFISLKGLSHGTYVLRIRAVNEDGVSTNPPLQITLVFLPKWYQTLLFRILVVLAIIAVLYGIFRYRIQQIKKQQQIRKDIASDLHDDIGSLLTSVKIFTHLAKREEQKDVHFANIEESLAQASMGLRDMIWVLDDSRDSIRELSERIKKFAVPITQVKNIRFECTVQDDLYDQELSKTVKRNLLLIAKETINNSIKYSDCSDIQVTVKEENKKLVFSIHDNGKGFNFPSSPNGNGLKNIQDRAIQIKWKAKIDSAPGNGTTIEIVEI